MDDMDRMEHSDSLKYYKKQILKKKILVIMAVTLVVGILFGTAIGSSIQKKKAEKRIEDITKDSRKAETKKIKELQQELFKEQEIGTKGEEQELPWNLMLVNSTHPMKEGYVPELTSIDDTHKIDTRIVEPLKEMLAAAKKDGMHILICSAYRSVDKQAQVFNSSVQERLNAGMSYWEAYKDTTLSVALPGTSEHGMGLALDLISNQYTELNEKQAETKEAKWLEENCYKYGFILRYPPEKTMETGIIYEPWHYRYVGKEDAEKIMKSGVTLETYLREKY